MVDIHISSDEIKKYLLMIVLFNAVFPNVLAKSDIVITIEDAEDASYVKKMAYDNFIDYYDIYGLNQVAE